MKKLIAVLLAVITVFSLITVAVYADEEPAEPVASENVPEEETTMHIQNEDGLVVPTSTTQLKFAFLFKTIEKVMKFILGIFGADLDATLSGGVASFVAKIEEIISNLDAGIPTD